VLLYVIYFVYGSNAYQKMRIIPKSRKEVKLPLNVIFLWGYNIRFKLQVSEKVKLSCYSPCRREGEEEV